MRKLCGAGWDQRKGRECESVGMHAPLCAYGRKWRGKRHAVVVGGEGRAQMGHGKGLDGERRT